MIISASRRTDIPAFFGEWFYNRLLSKEVYVRNPINYNNISKISLDQKHVDCIVFWTKDPTDFLKYIDKIKDLGHKFYFQFTINTYDEAIEKNVIKKSQIIDTFIKLSEMIGKQYVVWRYDPIIINNKYSEDYHSKYFEYLCDKLSDHSRECVISFVDEYSFLKKKYSDNDIRELNNEQVLNISKIFARICTNKNLKISTCSENIDLSSLGISHNKCIDDEIINELSGIKGMFKKDPSQREECGCVISRDIGAYSTCAHNCIYCYANKRNKNVISQICDPNSPLLCDRLTGTEKITIVEEKLSRNEKQKSLFD